jgi:hypothetical protein
MICIGTTRFNPDQTTTDLLNDFIKNGEIYLTYDPEVGAHLDLELKNLPLGTLVALKSFSVQHGLYIKAVGLIKDLPSEKPAHSSSRSVKWLWTGKNHFGRLNDKLDNMRSGAMYTELNPVVKNKIIELI